MLAMTAPPDPGAGWYPDKTSPEVLRYWDGSGWTDHTAPAAVGPPAGQSSAHAGRPVEMPSAAVESQSRHLLISRFGLLIVGLALVVGGVFLGTKEVPIVQSWGEDTCGSAWSPAKPGYGIGEDDLPWCRENGLNTNGTWATVLLAGGAILIAGNLMVLLGAWIRAGSD